MKNRRIIRAYDSINPSPGEKERMLETILAQADLEEKPRKQKKAPVVYTARPARSGSGAAIGAAAAAVLLLLLTGIILPRLNRQPDDPALRNPPGESAVSTVPAMTPADHYAPVLEKYRRAMEEGWTKEQCEIEGISLRMQTGADFTKAGYAFLDLDGDGREELLIAEESVPHMDLVWDIYTTLEDGTPIQLWVDECDGNQCYLYEGNIIGTEYSGKTQGESVYYALEAGQLVMIECIEYEDDSILYMDAEGDTRPISNQEFMAISNGYDHRKLSLTWLGDMPDYLRDTDTMERYAPVLEIYRTALTEHWDKDQCFEHDISTQAASSPDVNNNLGWCLLDIDDNGTQELIISYGSSLVDLYCLQPEGISPGDMVKRHGDMEHHLNVADGICHLARTEAGIQYSLCTDNRIQYQIIMADGTSWCWYQLKPWGLELEEVLVYRSGNDAAKAYAYGPDEDSLAYISKEEAGEIIFSHQPMELPVTPIVDWGTYTPEEPADYDSLIDLYQLALNEKWDPGKCVENGISLMIGNFTQTPEMICAFFLDLDSDGTQELMITDGMMIFDLYTLKNGQPVHLLTGWERNSYRYCADNIIFNHASNSAFNTCYNYYCVVNGSLMLVDSIIFDASKDPDNPWFLSTDGETATEAITEQKARDIMAKYADLSILGTPVLQLQ